MINDLCQVSDVRENLGLQPSTDVLSLQRFVTSVSSFISRETNRIFVPFLYSEVRNGTGTDSLVLKNTPVITVSSLVLDGVTLNPSTGYASVGYYVVDAMKLLLTQNYFRKDVMNVVCTYWAGFGGLAKESYSLSTQVIRVLNATWFYVDSAVVDANSGSVFAKVLGTPAVGQYSVNSDTGTYTFNAGDSSISVNISYWFRQIPYDLQQLAIELVSQKYKRRTHIDQDSQVLQGQTVQFSRNDVPKEVRAGLENYMQRGFIAA